MPIRVLHFTNAVVRSGAEEHLLSLLRLLDRQGFRLYLVCPALLDRQYGSDVPSDVERVSVNLHGPWNLGAAWRFTSLLRRWKINILHCHQFQSTRVAAPLARLAGVPIVIETTHVRESWRKGWIKGSFRIDRLVSHFVDHYVAVSQANARYLVEEKGLPREKVTVIENGVRLQRFDPSRPPVPGLKQKLGFNEEDPVLMVVARLEPQKGHAVLMEAMTRIRQRFANARLICVGDGALRAELEQQVRSLGLGEAVRFVGYQPNVEDWLALADVTVLPSYFEGLPLVAVECLAAGRPLVATAVDGTPEVVIDGRTGLTVPAGDPVALAGAIVRLLSDRDLGGRLAHAGREWVLGRFSEEQQAERTAALYHRLWGDRQVLKRRLAAREHAEISGAHGQ
jgi:glycosyltransferase involved in cell wall biosynthesis